MMVIGERGELRPSFRVLQQPDTDEDPPWRPMWGPEWFCPCCGALRNPGASPTICYRELLTWATG